LFTLRKGEEITEELLDAAGVAFTVPGNNTVASRASEHPLASKAELSLSQLPVWRQRVVDLTSQAFTERMRLLHERKNAEQKEKERLAHEKAEEKKNKEEKKKAKTRADAKKAQEREVYLQKLKVARDGPSQDEWEEDTGCSLCLSRFGRWQEAGLEQAQYPWNGCSTCPRWFCYSCCTEIGALRVHEAICGSVSALRDTRDNPPGPQKGAKRKRGQ
jgi:hypothetical protein